MAEAARPDTIWRIVYDLQNLTIYLQTLWNLQTRQFALSKFDFSPSALSQVYNPHLPGYGSVEREFVPYTTASNQELVKAFFQDEGIVKALGSKAETLGLSYKIWSDLVHDLKLLVEN